MEVPCDLKNLNYLFMKIIHIIPGSGGSFYCGNCLRDAKYFTALRNRGHDVVKVPMYLPLFADEHDLAGIPVFYGAVSIYLKQLFPVFRNAPAWIDRLLNSRPVLKLAARNAGSTRARGLEEMTISMLMGEKGKQQDELEEMVNWMAGHYKPDVIHLSNALLLGLAHRLRERIGAPLVCSLQDEDTWVDVMTPSGRQKAWELIAENSRYVDRFIAVSDYYREMAIAKMNLDPAKISSVHIGVDPDEYKYVNAAEKSRNLGFISRMCHENGLDILVDAFMLLKGDPAYEDVGLVITGGSTGDDSGFIRNIRKKLSAGGLMPKVDFHADFEGEGRQRFFSKVSLLSVPVRNGEAFGIYMAEAMASGIPVVQPSLGAFPEIIGMTGGGIAYGENSPGRLAAALRELLDDRVKLGQLSESARKGVAERLNIHILAEKMIDVYRQTIDNQTC